MITNITWWKPDKKTLSRIRSAMLLKALYTILSSIVLFGVLFLTDFLIFIDIEPGTNLRSFTLALEIVLYITLIIFYIYRATLRYGTTRPFDEDELFNGYLLKYYSVWFCAILSPLFIYLLSEYLPLKLALFVLIAILPFKKDYLMLMLYFSSKFDVKQGNILSSERVFRRKRGELGGRYLKLYLIYNLLFEDDMGRDIPVLVNHFNYRSFKNLEHPTEAMLIRYKCGKTLLFDVARI